MNLYYVYRFLNKDLKVIYVGRTNSMDKRMYQHFRQKGNLPAEGYESVHRVDFIECKTHNDMKIKELYYIGKYRPTYNRQENYDVSIGLNELEDVWVSFIQNAEHKKIFCEEDRGAGRDGYIDYLELQVKIKNGRLTKLEEEFSQFKEKVKVYVEKVKRIRANAS